MFNSNMKPNYIDRKRLKGPKGKRKRGEREVDKQGEINR